MTETIEEKVLMMLKEVNGEITAVRLNRDEVNRFNEVYQTYRHFSKLANDTIREKYAVVEKKDLEGNGEYYRADMQVFTETNVGYGGIIEHIPEEYDPAGSKPVLPAELEITGETMYFVTSEGRCSIRKDYLDESATVKEDLRAVRINQTELEELKKLDRILQDANTKCNAAEQAMTEIIRCGVIEVYIARERRSPLQGMCIGRIPEGYVRVEEGDEQ